MIDEVAKAQLEKKGAFQLKDHFKTVRKIIITQHLKKDGLVVDTKHAEPFLAEHTLILIVVLFGICIIRDARKVTTTLKQQT